MAVTAACFVGGLFLASASRRTDQWAKDLPRMRCEDVVRKGRAAPQFLTLTDVQLAQRGHAFHRDMDAAIEMYIPIYSTRLNQEPRPADLKLLLEVLDDRIRNRILEDPSVGELAVELWTDVDDLDPWIRNTLGAMYPGIQLANCRVLSAAACQFGWWVSRNSKKS
jgi:hypothetical protein